MTTDNVTRCAQCGGVIGDADAPVAVPGRCVCGGPGTAVAGRRSMLDKMRLCPGGLPPRDASKY